MSESTRKFTSKFANFEVTIIKRRFTGDNMREYNAAPRMFIEVKDETILDNLKNRSRRPYNTYKTLLRGSVIATILDLGNLRWSQYAGCSCPCSPGFILPHQVRLLGGETVTRFDVWVTIEGVPSVDETKAPRELVGMI
jgi:hypothetical protein